MSILRYCLISFLKIYSLQKKTFQPFLTKMCDAIKKYCADDAERTKRTAADWMLRQDSNSKSLQQATPVKTVHGDES